MCRKHICTVYRAIFRFRHGIPSLFCGLENRHSSNEGGGGGGGTEGKRKFPQKKEKGEGQLLYCT